MKLPETIENDKINSRLDLGTSNVYMIQLNSNSYSNKGYVINRYIILVYNNIWYILAHNSISQNPNSLTPNEKKIDKIIAIKKII